MIFLFGSFVLVRERSAVGIRNWVFTLTESLWLVCFGLAYASTRDELSLRWFVIGDVGVVFIPAALLAVNASVVLREKQLRGWVTACFALSALFCTALFTTDLFIKGLHHYTWGPAPAYGVVGVLFILYVVIVGVVSLVLFYRAYRTSTYPRFRARQRGFLISALIGYPAFLDFIPKLGFAFYPIGYLFVAAYVLYGSRVIVRYRLVDITPELATNQILETMQGAVMVADLEGRIRVVNRATLEMLGSEKHDLLGRSLAEVLPVAQVLLESIRAGELAINREMVWTGSDGQRHDVVVSASLLTEETDSQAMGIVFVAHDITKRKQAEERLRRSSVELREANKKLETLDRLKSDFVSTVSHELRTPLTSIKANAELIMMKPQLQEEKKQRLLTIINDESDRLGRLINDLLDLSRIEAGTVQWRSERVSWSEIIPLSVEGVLPLARNKDQRVITSLDDGLPVMQGDRDRVMQLLTNLLSNAIKFTPAGGAIAVRAHLEHAPVPRIVVSVTDTGVGIPPEDIELIFDKFHRSSRHLADQTEGTGLGLTIARQIVEHHGGDIWATSTLGSGSIFTFTIPLAARRLSGRAH